MRKRKLLACILILVLTIGTIQCNTAAAVVVEEAAPENTAEQNEDAEIAVQDIEIESDNSFGDLLASSLQEAQSEEGTAESTRIAEMEIENAAATVRCQTEQESDLVVAVYDESGKMLGSNTERIAGGGEDGTDRSEPHRGMARILSGKGVPAGCGQPSGAV